MVTINRQNDNFIFEVKGMHKLWAFKSQLIIPINHIISAHQDLETIKGWKGWKEAGTSIPKLITAGTFEKDGNKIFWDTSNIENCIIVNLKDEDYQELIIEVENPAEAIEILTK
jgi:hypothetical protein